MRLAAFLAVCAVLVAPAASSAQDDFSRFKLKLGQIVYVTDTSTGVEVNGPLKGLTADSLLIDGLRFTPTPVLKIERDGDPVWDGAIKGFGVGLLYGAALAAPECFKPRSKTGCVLRAAVSFAAIGALIDWNHKGRTRIYPENKD